MFHMTYIVIPASVIGPTLLELSISVPYVYIWRHSRSLVKLAWPRNHMQT